MKAENFSLSAYFDRIGLTQEGPIDIGFVTQMMRRQLFSVPFENLDVQAGKPISLVPEHIVDKIVGRRRGGYCYEVNGLFAMALEALGVAYQFVAARPMIYAVRRPKTHMAVVVHLQGEAWLCDLGFGSYGLRGPARLSDLDVDLRQEFDTFRLTQLAAGEYRLSALVDGAWADQYGFDLSPWEWVDFAPANWLNSTHPDTLFVQKLVAILHQETGRIVLVDDVLKTVDRGESHSRTLEPGERAAVLAEVFGLRLEAELQARTGWSAANNRSSAA